MLSAHPPREGGLGNSQDGSELGGVSFQERPDSSLEEIRERLLLRGRLSGQSTDQQIRNHAGVQELLRGRDRGFGVFQATKIPGAPRADMREALHPTGRLPLGLGTAAAEIQVDLVLGQ